MASTMLLQGSSPLLESAQEVRLERLEQTMPQREQSQQPAQRVTDSVSVLWLLRQELELHQFNRQLQKSKNWNLVHWECLPYLGRAT
jgi:hypothetical protein